MGSQYRGHLELDYQLEDFEDRMVKGEVEVTASHLTDLIVGSIINRILFGYRFDKVFSQFYINKSFIVAEKRTLLCY